MTIEVSLAAIAVETQYTADLLHSISFALQLGTRLVGSIPIRAAAPSAAIVPLLETMQPQKPAGEMP